MQRKSLAHCEIPREGSLTGAPSQAITPDSRVRFGKHTVDDTARFEGRETTIITTFKSSIDVSLN